MGKGINPRRTARADGRAENGPIGVFDSGLGGLTVVKELMRELPGEDIVYYGDTARVPYGTKSKEAIIGFSRENTAVLLRHKVKIVVVACNSSSSYALSILRREFDVPVIGVIEAGARKAAALTKNKRVGVIATSATIASGAYERSVHRWDRAVRVFSKHCPLFVPIVEEGWCDRPVARIVAEEYLNPLRNARVDTLILGCTHYPLLRDVLQRVMGRSVELVDSAREIAVQVREQLRQEKLEKKAPRAPRYRYLISDRPQEFKRIAKNFLGHELTHIKKV